MCHIIIHHFAVYNLSAYHLVMYSCTNIIYHLTISNQVIQKCTGVQMHDEHPPSVMFVLCCHVWLCISLDTHNGNLVSPQTLLRS